MRNTLPLALVGVSLALLAQSAAATPLALISDQRGVSVQYFNYFNDIVVSSPSTPFQEFDAMVALPGWPVLMASQQTTVGPSGMGGVIVAAATMPDPPPTPLDRQQPPFLRAISGFGVTFDATASTPYAWGGVLTHRGAIFATASLFDQTAGSTVFQIPFQGVGAGAPIPLDASGVLLAGHRYRLVLSLDADVRNGLEAESGSFAFQFVTPEPATGALLGLGLFALARRGRRSRRRARARSRSSRSATSASRRRATRS